MYEKGTAAKADKIVRTCQYEEYRDGHKMPEKPEKPTWVNDKPIYTSDLGAIYELETLDDRVMHTLTAGQCFVYNYNGQSYEDGYRLFSYRTAGTEWAYVSIQIRTYESCASGEGSRMYTGGWQRDAEKHGVKVLNGENVILFANQKAYSYRTTDAPQAVMDAQQEDVYKWWAGLPDADPTTFPEITEKAKSQNYWA